MSGKLSLSKKIKKPWPTKKVMEQIYDQNLWGSNRGEYFSGYGSHNVEIVEPYIKVVKDFFKSFDSRIIVCDLGCGDFNIGKHLLKYTEKYLAIDIAENLINYNKEKFKEENLKFKCLDISKDRLPKADCVLLRQVLQHLSNAEVQSILNKLLDYKYVIITEHLPSGDFIPNKDIIAGQGIRLKKQSGLDVFKSPFSFKVKSQKELLCINLGEKKGVIITWLFEMP